MAISMPLSLYAQFSEQQKQQLIEQSHSFECSVYESTNFVILRFVEADGSGPCEQYVKSMELLKSQGFHIAGINDYLIFMEK